MPTAFDRYSREMVRQYSSRAHSSGTNQFQRCLSKWITSLHEIRDGELIAIDGKTLRRSYDPAGSSPRFTWSVREQQRIHQPRT